MDKSLSPLSIIITLVHHSVLFSLRRLLSITLALGHYTDSCTLLRFFSLLWLLFITRALDFSSVFVHYSGCSPIGRILFNTQDLSITQALVHYTGSYSLLELLFITLLGRLFISYITHYSMLSNTQNIVQYSIHYLGFCP